MQPTENHEANRRTASESRMREIRPSGSMRGRRGHGVVATANHPRLPTLLVLRPAPALWQSQRSRWLRLGQPPLADGLAEQVHTQQFVKIGRAHV